MPHQAPQDWNSGFGWMPVIGGSVIAGIGLIWVLFPNLPKLGHLPGPRRYRDREGEQPVLLSHRDVHRDQRRAEPCDVADPCGQALIRTG
jgi:hypothetical protein